MSTPRSDSLAGIREQAPLEMNVKLTQSLWILWHQCQLPFFGRILRRNPILAKSGNSFRPLTGTPRIFPKSYLLSYSLFIAFPSTLNESVSGFESNLRLSCLFPFA